MSYLTTNILKLSAAIHLNFENKIFVDLNLFLELHKPLNGHWSMVLGWGVLRSSSSCPQVRLLDLQKYKQLEWANLQVEKYS